LKTGWAGRQLFISKRKYISMQLLFLAFEQLLFYCCFRAILLVLRLFFKAIVYSPQLITGYLLCKLFLNKSDTALLWIIAIILIAGLIQLFILLLKQITISLRNNGNVLWIPILLVCLAYTCIFPVWLVFNSVKYLMNLISAEKSMILTWLFSTGFGIFLYLHYDFLNLRSE
jgi:hypothetical protein